MKTSATPPIRATVSLDKSQWDRIPALAGFYLLVHHGDDPMLVRVESAPWPLRDRMRIPVAFVPIHEALDATPRLVAGSRFDVLELADGTCIARGEVLPNDTRRDVSWTIFLATIAGLLVLHIGSALAFGLAFGAGLKDFIGSALFTALGAWLSEITVKGRIGLTHYYLAKGLTPNRTHANGHPRFPDTKQAHLRLQMLIVFVVVSLLVFVFRYLAYAAAK